MLVSLSPAIADPMPHGADHAPSSPSAKPAHPHKTVAVPAGTPVPTLALIAHPDPMGGWNLEIKASQFDFAPELVNTKSTGVNQGHAHLYINGKKISRLYGTWYHLPALPPGTHTIRVGLTTNDHADITHNGNPIQASQTITVK